MAQLANQLVVGRAADQLLAASVVSVLLERLSSLEVYTVTEDRRSRAFGPLVLRVHGRRSMTIFCLLA